MICPSVPEAHTRPLASGTGTPARTIAGRLISASMTIVAPMMPVEAATSAATATTASASPRREPPSSRAITSSIRSAARERSSSSPIATNSGTATSNVLFASPNRRCGKARRKSGSKWPAAMPTPATPSGTPSSTSMTGTPDRMPPSSAANSAAR